MIEAIFWLAVGAIIGWHFPEPQWAKNLKVKAKGLFAKKDA